MSAEPNLNNVTKNDMLWGCSNILAAPGIDYPQLLRLEMQKSRV